jgi:hypothetical protein
MSRAGSSPTRSNSLRAMIERGGGEEEGKRGDA